MTRRTPPLHFLSANIPGGVAEGDGGLAPPAHPVPENRP